MRFLGLFSLRHKGSYRRTQLGQRGLLRCWFLGIFEVKTFSILGLLVVFPLEQMLFLVVPWKGDR